MHNRILIISSVALAFVSCNKTEVEQIYCYDTSLYAEMASGEAKTVLQDDGTSLWWSPGDEIKVFYGDRSARFSSQNTEPSGRAEFKGVLDVQIAPGDGIWAIYPYSVNDTLSDGTLFMSVPSEQKVKADVFPSKTFPSVARTTSSNLTFYNVCGGLKFSVVNDNITSIRFAANGGESIVGDMEVSFGEDGKPVSAAGKQTDSVLTIIPSDHIYFRPLKTYYAVLQPSVLSSGFTMTFETSDSYASRITDIAVEVSRSRFGVFPMADLDLEFKQIEHPVDSIRLSDDNIHLGVDEKYQLKAYVFPENATDRSVTWSNSDLTIVSVDNDGILTGKSVGRCTIIATTGNGASDTCSVYVDACGDPTIKLDKTALTFEKPGASQTVALTSNRDWEVRKDDNASWVTVTPASGKASSSAQTITIAVDENTGEERIAEITFSTGSATTNLKITQAGAVNRVYFNNFDKEAATQTSSKWPYIYATDCWKNETGTGIANVRYITEDNSATIRNNSNSTGSGVNNVCFGSSSRFCVKNIALNSGVVNYTVSFYGIRNVYGKSTGQGESIFDHTQFKLYVSGTGDKWVALDYVFEGGDPDAEWGQASATFTVPTGTTTLCIGVPTPSETSTYRIDDLKLVESATAGTAVDFTQGIEISEFKESPAVDPHKTITTEKVSEAIAAETGDTVILNNALVVATAKTGYLVTDSQNTEYILVYKGTSSTDTPATIGDKVNVKGVRGEYNSMPQLNTPATTVVSQGTQVTWPTPEDITSTFDSFTSTTVKYISYKGKLTVGNFYNITVDGATKTGSILPATAAEAYKDIPAVTFKGYYLYTFSNKYIYTIFTEAEVPDYLIVTPTAANVDAYAGTTTINVSSNVSWTASSDNAEFTLSPASGTDNGTITVTYPENVTESAKTAKITISTASEGVIPVEVNITQAKAGAATYTWTLAPGNLTTAGGTFTSGEATWTYPAAGYINFNEAKGTQIGSGNKPQTSYTISTDYFTSPKVVSSITVNASIANSGDAKLSIAVDGVDVLTNQTLTTTATDYTVNNINKSGTVEIKFTATAKAYYLKSVSVGNQGRNLCRQ